LERYSNMKTLICSLSTALVYHLKKKQLGQQLELGLECLELVLVLDQQLELE